MLQCKTVNLCQDANVRDPSVQNQVMRLSGTRWPTAYVIAIVIFTLCACFLSLVLPFDISTLQAAEK